MTTPGLRRGESREKTARIQIQQLDDYMDVIRCQEAGPCREQIAASLGRRAH